MSNNRPDQYTRPGYEIYARSFRFIRSGNIPEVFGAAVCMSSTFSYKDDLIERVLSEPRRKIGFYLDSGWPGDNYEVTMAMALALVSRGWRYGRDLIQLAFPQLSHDEKSWGMRLHLPMQFFTGAVARASRRSDPQAFES